MPSAQDLFAKLPPCVRQSLADPSVQTLALDHPQQMWIERGPRRSLQAFPDLDQAQILQIIQLAQDLLFAGHSDAQSSSPGPQSQQGFFSLDISPDWRLTWIPAKENPPTTPLLRFFRPRPKSLRLADLQPLGLLSPLAQRFLSTCVQARQSLLLISPERQAATQVLTALASEIPALARTGLVLAGAHESLADAGLIDPVLSPDCLAKVAVLPDQNPLWPMAEALGLDQLWISDLSADQAPDFLREAPHWPGSSATMRGGNANLALLQLSAWLSAQGLGESSARALVQASFALVVEIGRDPDGLQRLRRIAEVDPEAPWPGLRDVFVSRLAEDPQAAVPVLVPTGNVPHFLPAFAPLGVVLEARFFAPETHGFAPTPATSWAQASTIAPLSTSTPPRIAATPSTADLLRPPSLPQTTAMPPRLITPSPPAAPSPPAPNPLTTDRHDTQGDKVLGAAAAQPAWDQEDAPSDIPDDPGWEVEVLHRSQVGLPSGGPPDELPPLPPHLAQGLSPSQRRNLGELIPEMMRDDEAEAAQSAENQGDQGGAQATPSYKPQAPAMHPQALHLHKQLEPPSPLNTSIDPDPPLPSQAQVSDAEISAQEPGEQGPTIVKKGL